MASPAFAACADRVRAIVALLTDRIDDALLARAPALARRRQRRRRRRQRRPRGLRARGTWSSRTRPDVLTEATADLAFGLLLAAARRIVRGRSPRPRRRVHRLDADVPPRHARPRHEARHRRPRPHRQGGRAARARLRDACTLHAAPTRARGAGARARRDVRASLDELCALVGRDLDPLPAHAGDAPPLLRRAPRADEARHRSWSTRRAGRCVDEAALAHALEHGPLAAAGRSTSSRTSRASPPPAPARAVRTSSLAPHIGSADDARARRWRRMAAGERPSRVLRGEPLAHSRARKLRARLACSRR